MLLEDQIKAMQQQMLPRLPEHILTVLLAATQRLVRSGIAQRAVKIGSQAPAFSLPNLKGKTVSSANLLAKGPLVISFYRGGWCPYCNLELRALQQYLPEITRLGARVVAISPELADKSITTVEKHALTFDVLTDAGNRVAREFGLVFSLDHDIRPIYKEFGYDLTQFNGDESWELPIPATYIVSADGTVAHAFISADYTKRLEPTEIIATLERIAVTAE